MLTPGRCFVALLVASVAAGCTETPRESVGALSGHVAAIDGVALGGVTIVLTPSERRFTTDADGDYTFGQIHVGDYSLLFSKDGFEDVEEHVKVVHGRGNRLDVTMRPKGGAVEVEQPVEVTAGMLYCSPEAQTVELTADVTVQGTEVLSWSLDTSPAPWLKATTPTEGSVPPGRSTISCAFDIDRSGMTSTMTAVMALRIGANSFAIVSTCEP